MPLWQTKHFLFFFLVKSKISYCWDRHDWFNQLGYHRHQVVKPNFPFQFRSFTQKKKKQITRMVKLSMSKWKKNKRMTKQNIDRFSLQSVTVTAHMTTSSFHFYLGPNGNSNSNRFKSFCCGKTHWNPIHCNDRKILW